MASSYEQIRAENQKKYGKNPDVNSYDQVRKRNSLRYGSAVDSDYVNQYLSDHRDYWSGYGAGKDPTNYRLEERRAAIDNWLQGSLADGSIDQSYYDQAMEILGGADAYVGLYQGQRDVGSYMDDWANWYNGAADALGTMDWETGRGGSASLDEGMAGFGERDAAARAWLETYRGQLGEDYYKAMMEQLDSYGGYADSLRAAYDQNAAYFNQWDSREGYDRYQKLGSMDVEAMEAGLEAIRKAYDDMYMLEGEYGLLANDLLSDEERAMYTARYEDIQQGYGANSQEIRERMLQMERDLEEAKKLQEAAGYVPEAPRSKNDVDWDLGTITMQLGKLRQEQRQLKNAELYSSDSANLNSANRLGEIEAQIEELERKRWQLERESRFNYLEQREDYGQYSQYDPENQNNHMALLINTGENLFPKTGSVTDGDVERFLGMTESEKGTYNYLYNTQGAEAAGEYLVFIKPQLDARATMVFQEELAEFSEKNLGSSILANALSVGTNLVSGVGYLDIAGQHLAQDLTGYYMPINYYGSLMAPTHATRAIRQTTAGNIADKTGTIQLDPEKNPFWAKILNGRGLSDVYQLGMSAIDSKVAALTGNAAAATALLASSAATSGVLDALENGATDEQALKMGLWNGLFEATFEYLEVENLLKGDPSWVKATVNQAITEGLGEGFTSIANNIADVIIMADESQIMRTAAEYEAEGMDRSKAIWNALADAGVDVLWDTIGGAASGAMSVGGMAAIDTVNRKMQYNSLPQDVKNSVARLENYGMDRDTALRTSGLLYDQGKVYGDNVGAFIMGYVPGQEVTQYAADFNAAYEIGRNNGNRDYIGKTSLTQAQGEVAYKLGQEAGKKKAAAPEERPDTQTEYTVSDDGKTVDVKTGKAVEVTGFKSVGKNPVLETKDGSISAQDVSFGTEDEAVVYEVIGRTIGSAGMANNVLKAYAEAVKGGMSASDFAAGLQQAYDLGFKGQVAERQLGTYGLAGALPVGVRGAAFNQGKRMGDIRTAARDAAVRKQGREAKGDRQGTFHFDRKGRTFSKTQEASLGALEALSKALVVDIYVYESYEKGGKRVYQDRTGAEKKAPNGYYDEQGIHIDLNAGNLGQGTMMFTVAHELTHFIKEWSPVKFRKLADLLVSRYAEQGTSVRDLIDAQIVKAEANGRTIDRDTAFEEVVADSMEVMLTQGDMSRFMAQLQQKDKTLREKVREWFKDLAQKLQAVVDSYKGAAPDSPEGRLVAQMGDFISVLQEAYAEALVDAAGSYKASEGNKKTTREGGEEKFSIRRTMKMSLKDQLKEYYKRLFFRSDSFYFGTTPSVLKRSGIEALPLAMGQDDFKKSTVLKHNIPRRVLLNIQNDLAHPLFSFTAGNQSGIMTSDIDGDGKPVVVAIHGGHNMDRKPVNLMKSIYGVESVGEWVADQINSGAKFRIYDVEKTIAMLQTEGYLAEVGADGNGSWDIITSTRPDVNKKPVEKRSDRDPTAAATAEALEKQNAKLRQDVADLRELLRMQGKLTHGTEFRKSSIDAAVKGLAQTAGATLDAEGRAQLHDMLKGFYKYIASDDSLAWENVREEAGKIADFLQSNVKIKPEMTDYARDVLREIRGRKITLDDKQRAEVEHLYGSYEAFRKGALGSVTFVKEGGISLDSFWHEMASMFPGTFDEDVSSNDQPQALLDVIESMRNSDTNIQEYAYNREFIRQDLIQAVYDSYWRVDNMNTVADRKQREINEIRRKHNERMDALKANQRETVQRLKEQRSDDIRKVREEYQERSRKQVQAVRERYEASRARVNESRAATQQRQIVEKAAKDLMQMLSRPTKEAHVPMELQKPLEKFLDSIDFTSNRAKAGGEPTIRDVAYTRALMDVKAAIAAQRSAINGAEDGTFALDVPAEFIEMIDEHIRVISKATEGLDLTTNRVYEMTSDELRDLAFILKTINKAVRQIDKLHMAGAKAKVSELAKSTVWEMGGREKTKTETGLAAMWANYTPTFAFERMGKAATQILDGLKQGQSKLARTADSVIKFTQQTYTGKEVKAWEEDVHHVKLDSGDTVQMTTAQIMSFYCLSRREQAKGHMNGGGIRIGNIGEGGKAILQRDHYRLTQKDIAKINGLLTDRQIKVANDLQRYMADVGGRLGNEISMARWDYMEMTDRDYFPIKSDNDVHDARNPDQDKANLWGLLNKSFTKAVVKGANDAMVVSSIFDVFANHMSEMAEYNAFALPLVDAMKWFNYRETTKLEGEQIKTVGVKKALNDTLGTAACKYFIDLMTDINSSQKGGRYENFFGKLLSRSKGASVGWNLRVAIQQPTAILRASVYVDPKSLAKGFTRFGHKKLGEEMLKYSGIALWKSMGYYDLNISRGITEQIKGDSTWLDKVNDAGMWLPGKMDQWTWTSIWAACKDKVERETKLTGEALLQKTAEVFDDLVYHTQVADSVLTRSSLMRSKSQTVKELTSFMAEPTMSANLLLSAFQDYREGVTKGEKAKRALRIAFCGYVLSGIANAFITAFADAWRDDDEYESFWEKYGQALLGEKFIDGNLFAELNPLEKIVFVRDVLSLIQGYEGAKNPFVELAESGIKLLQNVSRFLKGEGSLTSYGLIYQGLQVLGSFTGAAPANLTREVVAIWNNTFGKWNNMMIHKYKTDKKSSIRDAYKSGALSKREAQDALIEEGLSITDAYYTVKGWETGNTSKYDDLYKTALAGGDIAGAVSEMVEYGAKEKEVLSQLKSQIGTWYTDPESKTRIDRDQAEDMLRQYFDLEDDEIEELLLRWDMKLDAGFTLDSLKEKFMEETVSVEEAVKYLTEYGGMKEDDARERVDDWAFELENGYSFDDIRQTYLDGEITSEEARAVLMERAGKTEDDASYSIELWDFEKDNGWKYENRASLYKNGDITAQQLVDALIDVGEYDRKDAEYQVEVYDWEMDGLEGATVKRVKTWHEYCEKAGVSKEQFLQIQTFSANTKNDVDANGKTINYSAMKKVMAEINKLPLSASQKDALAKAIGWSDKNIRKYKPW